MRIVIIGNGIAGITVARHLRKRSPSVQLTVISGETDHHFSRPALMYVFMGHMRYEQTKPYEDQFWKKNRIELIRGWAHRIDTDDRAVHIGGQEPIRYDRLVLATGSRPNRFGWPGQDLDRVQGLYSVQDLERLENAMPHVRRAVIVGGGLIGIELAEMLLSRGREVTFLVREPSYWANVLPREESEAVSSLVRAHHIDLRLETELAEILDDGTGAAGGVRTGDGETIDCQLVGLTAGVRPETTLARDSGIPCRRGILVDRQFRTSVPDVWACGDCAEIRAEGEERGIIQQVWYTGRIQGEACAESLCGVTLPYRPGIWFNSAKFFDLEYQTYGTVPSALAPRADLASLFWSDDTGRSIRIVHDAAEQVVGFNLMGVRFRHRVCETWIAEARDLAYVRANLAQAFFDPELSRSLRRDLPREMIA